MSPIVHNRLLMALGDEDLAAFLPHLTPVKLGQRQLLIEIGDAVDHVYFIESGVASVLAIMENGASIEVGMIGVEGIAGVPALLGERQSAQRIVAQLPGSALRMNASRCKELFEERESVRKVFLPFINALMNLSAQTAACNRLHSMQQRLARWLLLSSDRIQSNILPLTHEYLSSMLGVRRAGVTETAGELQRRGLIRYHHGQITIVDHKGLQAAACECYALNREQFYCWGCRR